MSERLYGLQDVKALLEGVVRETRRELESGLLDCSDEELDKRRNEANALIHLAGRVNAKLNKMIDETRANE